MECKVIIEFSDFNLSFGGAVRGLTLKDNDENLI